ncbi:class I SAM-dependent methyltransferase [Tenacibaculum xiamenense]|uniref:class I SAM-dependent methyltransferase n=1 Tax=Tenacibaculum xiamenense TaxID=1261553 RepID=UPI0038954AF3
MKDNFSLRSDNYAKFRPSYPSDFFDYLSTLVTNKENAWDCGTGNGQIAYQLSKSFQNVFASDISQSQLDNAFKAENIHYSKQPSEKTNFNNQTFDLITVAQAIHWFNFEKFYDEVKRTSRENSILCVMGYGRVRVSDEIDEIIDHFYINVIGKYWDKERSYIDKNYQTIPFPFQEIQTPKFINEHYWNLDHFIGYLNTWSAVKHFTKSNNFNPVKEVQKKLNQYWAKNELKKINFPLLLRIGVSK